MFGMADSLWMYYTANIIIAFGTGFQGLLVLSVVINHWFRRKRTLAQSFMGTGYALAGIIGVPIIVAAQTSLGWRMTAIGSGIIIWIVGFPAAMYLIRKPELYGLLPDGNVANNTPNSIKIDEHDFTLKEALRTRAFWLLGISNALGNFGMSSVQTHIFLHLQEGVKLTPAAAAFVWSITCISNLPSRLVAGYLGDRKPKYIVLGIAITLMGLSVFILGISNSMPMAITFAVIYGIGWGARTPVTNAIQGDYFGRKSQGVIRGWLQIISLPFAITAPVLTGYMADVNGNYRLVFMIMSAVSVLGGVLTFAAKPPKRTKRWDL
jgi:MFS family permease